MTVPSDLTYEELLDSYSKLERSFHALSNKHDHAQKVIGYKDKKIGGLNVKINKMIRDRDISDSVYKKQIRDLDKTISEKNSIIDELEEKILKLTAQLNRDFTNSSIPSSYSPNHKKISNSRIRTGKKPGAQKGHAHHPRKKPDPTQTIELDIPEEVKENPESYVFERTIRKSVVDIKVITEVIEYVGFEYRMKGTNTKVRSVFPNSVKDEINYGKGIKSFACLLNNYCNVSIRKVQETIENLTSKEIKISVGKINGLAKEFSTNTKEERNEIFKNLLLSPYQNTDATYIRVNGKTNYVYVSANENETYYTFKEHKGADGIADTPVEDYQGVLIHDHDKVYFRYGTAHQKCLSHELRYLQDSISNEPNLTWNVTMKSFLQEVIHKFKSEECSIQKIIDRYDEIIEIGSKEYEEHPPGKYYRDGYNTFRRLRDYKESVLYFLEHPAIPYTNNLAERKARQIKRKSVQVNAFRSRETTEYYCNLMTMIETSKSRKENVYDMLLEHF